MNDNQKNEGAELERLNAKLSESLDRCRRLLSDCQSKLAANGSRPPDAGGRATE